MTQDVSATKNRIRHEMRSRLAALSPEYRQTCSAAAFEVLSHTSVWQQANNILFFAPIAPELDVWPWLLNALDQGKTVALPRYDSTQANYSACRVTHPVDDIVTGRFSIREPSARCKVLPLIRLDLILVPGVAFDLHGHRLGRGKGYYDKMLADVHGATCGVAYEEQILERVPVEPHDRQLTRILTPKRWVVASPGSVLA